MNPTTPGCRSCGAPLTTTFIDLGLSPPANGLTEPADAGRGESFYPLHAYVCDVCLLVQLDVFETPEQIFRDYSYFSSYSTSWLQHAEDYVEAMRGERGIGPGKRVVELASNDGYLLQYFIRAGIEVLGIDPASNVAVVARERGVPTLDEFFGRDVAERVAAEYGPADLIVANNVLAHVPDINDFVGGFASLLKRDGVATFEFPHLMEMVRNNQFDTAYHEHYSYLSLTAVSKIFAANGLAVFDVQRLPTHGGSLRVFAQRADSGGRPIESIVSELLREEAAAGVMRADFYRPFQGRAERIKDDALMFLIEAKRGGKKIGAYGAAAKGNTLLNFAGARPDLIPYVVDRNPAKQSQFMPGSRIPIVPESRLIEDRPDIVVILPWNLKDELTRQLGYVKDWGGSFVTFVPKLTVW